VISHGHRFIYVHVPKTGGNTMRQVLGRYGIWVKGRGQIDCVYHQHAKAKDIARALGPEFGTYYRFATVRNPWDWVVSNYTYNRGLHLPYVVGTVYEHTQPGDEWLRRLDFADWLAWWTEELRPTQTSMLVDEEGQVLLDEVFRLEAIDRAVATLRGRLGLADLPDPERRNASNRDRDYRPFYTDATAELVARAMARDIEEFGYSFDEPSDCVLKPAVPPSRGLAHEAGGTHRATALRQA
jgi:hypothetical protein